MYAQIKDQNMGLFFLTSVASRVSRVSTDPDRSPLQHSTAAIVP